MQDYCTQLNSCSDIRLRMWLCLWVFACKCAFMCGWVGCCIRVCVWGGGGCVCVCVCAYARVYICVFVCVCPCKCMCEYAIVCVFACVCLCMWIKSYNPVDLVLSIINGHESSTTPWLANITPYSLAYIITVHQLWYLTNIQQQLQLHVPNTIIASMCHMLNPVLVYI